MLKICIVCIYDHLTICIHVYASIWSKYGHAAYIPGTYCVHKGILPACMMK